MDGDVTAYTAVLHYAASPAVICDISRDATHIFHARDAGIGQDDVPDGGTTCHTKETLVAVSIGVTALVDADAADGMVLTVKRAAEKSITIVNTSADGGEVVLGAGGIVPIRSVGIGDVGTQFEVLAVKVVAAVHQRGQQVQASGCGDGVGLVLAAVGIVRDAPMVCPLGIEGDNIVIAHCEVRNILSVGVAVARAVGSGAPSGKGATRAGEGIGGEVLRSVVGEGHVAHRTLATVGVEADGIVISRQLGVEGSVGSDVPTVGAGAGSVVVFGAATIGLCIVAAECVARPNRNADGGHGGVKGCGDRCCAGSGGTLVV